MQILHFVMDCVNGANKAPSNTRSLMGILEIPGGGDAELMRRRQRGTDMRHMPAKVLSQIRRNSVGGV